ncbi:MAG: ATP-binding protein [Candidatus Saccharibacteria bacterium]|nr:ATP-binding protein [Candidatus Saccharibacteria bacterium]
MQHVPLKWLTRLRLALGLYSLYFVAGYGLTTIFELPDIQSALALNVYLAILASVHLLYELSIGLLMFKRSPWTSAAISLAAVSLIAFIAIEMTGNYSSPYWIMLFTLIFLSGMLGSYIAPGFVFILTIGLVFSVTGFFTGDFELIHGLTVVGLGILISVINHFVWRRYYETPEKKDSQLAAMLKNKQLQSETLVRSISDGVIVTDTDGKITLMNPAAATLSAWPIEEATGLDLHSVLSLTQENDAPLEVDLFKQVMANKKPASSYVTLTDRQGSRKYIVSLVISPVLAPKTEELLGVVAVLRDVSRQRREEQQRAEFISTASHEMRTPVAAIEGYLALAMNEKISKIDSKARSHLEKAYASTKHLGKLFQDLLTSAKAEDGRLVSHPVVVEMGSYLEKLVDTLKFGAEKKGLLTDFVIGGTEESGSQVGGKVVRPLYYASVDPDRLREAITNLFDNAVKYTEKGKVSIGLTGDQQVIQIFIQDTGSGIPAEDVPHLFQKFYRVDNSATRTVGGTGLGLFICRKIIELYGGRIWVESTVGKGSTFYINLPRLDTQQAQRLQASQTDNSTQT